MTQGTQNLASVGIGGLAALLTNGIIVAKVQPMAEGATAGTFSATEESFWFKYRAYIAALAAVISGIVLWKVWGKDEGLLAGVGGGIVALAPKINDYVATEIREKPATFDYPALPTTGYQRHASNVAQLVNAGR